MPVERSLRFCEQLLTCQNYHPGRENLLIYYNKSLIKIQAPECVQFNKFYENTFLIAFAIKMLFLNEKRENDYKFQNLPPS